MALSHVRVLIIDKKAQDAADPVLFIIMNDLGYFQAGAKLMKFPFLPCCFSMIPYAAAPVPFIFMNDLRYLFPNRVQIDKISFFTMLLFMIP